LERFSSVTEAIKYWVTETPKSVAVYQGDQALSYGELWDRASALAIGLRRRGIGSERTVGLWMQTSIDAIVGIVGVLISGGAYIPISIESPPMFVRRLIRDAEVEIVLTDRPLIGSDLRTAVMSVEQWPVACSVRPSEDKPSLSQLAYIIFTSGSTGSPKGVMVEHGNLMSSLMAREYYYGCQTRCSLLLPALAFDSSVGVIFPVLCGGNALVVPQVKARPDPHALVHLIERFRISEILTLPGVYNSMLDIDGAPEKIASLERIILAGERLPAALVKRHFSLVNKVPLYNEYGPTEATVWSTVHSCSDLDIASDVPIGKSIRGATIFLLDPSTLEPVTEGTEGEILIGGPIVARGYLGQVETTASKFIPDHLSGGFGLRLYRTGDLAHIREDGVLIFHGRIDEQAKVRGYRIELGHIESELSHHPSIRCCAAIVRKSAPWAGNLIVFFETKGTKVPSIGELHDFLGKRLPTFMLPAAYISVQSLPRNPNGKLNRSELAITPLEPSRTLTDHVSPRNSLEERLCKLWCEVLALPKISVLDHYLDFGADSIAVMRFTAASRNEGLPVQPADVLIHETVAALAVAISDNRELAESPSESSDEPTGPFYRRHDCE
jgi:amino acid adenylation domain-containing protein